MDVIGASHWDNTIAWWENTDGLGISWIEHTIHTCSSPCTSVYSEDIDGDGDMDVIGAMYLDNEISWWENVDGSGATWTEHIVDGGFHGARSVISADIDGDGELDIAAAAYLDDDITWWRNINGSGTSWTEYAVDGSFDGAWSLHAEDVDGDSDVDADDFIGVNAVDDGDVQKDSLTVGGPGGDRIVAYFFTFERDG